MLAEKAHFPIRVMARVLGVTASGYYAWRGRPLITPQVRADRRLRVQIRTIHAQSAGRYGSPRIHRALRDVGERVSRKRVIRLMQVDQLLRPAAASVSGHDAVRPQGAAGAEPSRPALHGGRAESGVGGRHHGAAHDPRVDLSGGVDRSLVATRRGLGYAPHTRDRAGDRHVGARRGSASHRARGASFGSGRPIHQRGVPASRSRATVSSAA